MRKFTKLIIIAVAAGLLVGVLGSSMMTEDKISSCEKAERAIKNQSNLDGAIACFPPGAIDINQSDRVEQGTELECVCRRSHEGKVQFWNINRAN